METDPSGGTIYTKSSIKHKMWTVMFEVFPSLALQIYATLVETNAQISVTFTASIIFSCINVCFTVWWYMVAITNQSETDKLRTLVQLQNGTSNHKDIHTVDLKVSSIETEKQVESPIASESEIWQHSPTNPSMHAPKPMINAQSGQQSNRNDLVQESDVNRNIDDLENGVI